jgi:hypothetical protein
LLANVVQSGKHHYFTLQGAKLNRGVEKRHFHVLIKHKLLDVSDGRWKVLNE